MADFAKALDKLIQGFEGFTDTLREMQDYHQDAVAVAAGAGEDDDDDYKAPNQGAARGGIDDDTDITMKSGDLRKVVDAYRYLVRLARTGKIPTGDQRQAGHAAVRKVKHLIRKPVRG